jgi:hypothetical protein
MLRDGPESSVFKLRHARWEQEAEAATARRERGAEVLGSGSNSEAGLAGYAVEAG